MANIKSLARSRAFIPSKNFRSPTAVQGQVDVRDDPVYSSIVVAHGGTGSQKFFTVPQGQAIPSLKAASDITLVAAHHLTHSELTTNLTKSGEFGQSIGDASVRSIALDIENAPIKADGTYELYGATPHEVVEIQNKCYFQFKVGGKVLTQARFGYFPCSTGATGSLGVATTKTTTTVVGGYVNNGNIGGRRLKLPINIARQDTVEGILGTSNGSSLAFVTTTGAGQETLITCMLGATVAGDVR